MIGNRPLAPLTAMVQPDTRISKHFHVSVRINGSQPIYVGSYTKRRANKVIKLLTNGVETALHNNVTIITPQR